MSGIHSFHMVGDKYLRALALAADVYPVAIPCFGNGAEVLGVLDRVDGLFLPGSPRTSTPPTTTGSRARRTPGRTRSAIAMPYS